MEGLMEGLTGIGRTGRIGRTDDEAEVPILWPPDAKN